MNRFDTPSSRASALLKQYRLVVMRFGRDVEKMVLARGLRAHLEDRVLVHDNKTVLFD